MKSYVYVNFFYINPVLDYLIYRTMKFFIQKNRKWTNCKKKKKLTKIRE